MATKAELQTRAKQMRNNPTEWEKRLWRHLSNPQLAGYKFRRQSVIGNYIADFLCPAKALIVEVDGTTHDPQQDAMRDRTLDEAGYQVCRVRNEDVRDDMPGVLEHIRMTLQSLPDRWPKPHPSPSPNGEGLSR